MWTALYFGKKVPKKVPVTLLRYCTAHRPQHSSNKPVYRNSVTGSFSAPVLGRLP
jgi:hypothetical protein